MIIRVNSLLYKQIRRCKNKMESMFKSAPSEFEADKCYDMFGSAFAIELARRDSTGGYSVEYSNPWNKK